MLQTVQKNPTIYIWTVRIYRLYRRQCAKYTYIYSVYTVYYKDILSYQYTLYTVCTLWRVGRGREPWEWSEAGGVNDNDRHLRHSPVSSPHGGASEGIKGGVTRQWKTREDQAWNFSLCFVCGSRPWGAAAFHLCLFILLLNVLNVRRFPPPSSRIYHLRHIGAEAPPPPGGQRGLSDSMSLLHPGLRHQCNADDRYGKKEAGTGEHLIIK